MSFLYLVAAVILLILFYVGFILMKHFDNKTMINIILCAIIFTCYIVNLCIIYSKVGWADWNFQNALPYSNISPFMFFTCPLFFIVPKKVRKYVGSLYAILVVGMVLSPVLTSIRYFSTSVKFHASFMLDYVSHLAFALWGVYLVQSKQIELNKKDSLIGGSIIVSVALIMLIINAIFDKAFFGLSLRGKHNIYNVVLVNNSFASALIYFSGLIAVLFAGYFFEKLLIYINKKNKAKE